MLTVTGLRRHLLYRFSPRLIAVPEDAVDAVLADLARAGHTPRVDRRVRPRRSRAGEGGTDMALLGRRLPALLNSYSAAAIRQMAQGRDLAPKDQRKPTLIAAIEAAAADPESVRRAVEALSPEQRALLVVLLRFPGEANQDLVEAAAVAAGVIPGPAHDPYRYYGYYREQKGDPTREHSTQLVDLVAGLTYRVLALTAASGGYTPAYDLGLTGLVLIPAEIRPVLLDLLTPADPPVTPAPGPAESAAPRHLQRAFFLLWSALRDKPATLTQAGYLRKTDVRRLGQVLRVLEPGAQFNDETDVPFLLFLRVLAMRFGILQVVESRLEAGPPERMRAFLAPPWPEQSRQVLEAWIDEGSYDLAQTVAAPGPEARPAGRAVPQDMQVRGYRRLLRLLRDLPDGWIALEAFVDWIRLRHFAWLALPDADPYATFDVGTVLFQITPGYGRAADLWDASEGRAIRDAITRPLAWLGLVEGAGAPGRDAAFRVTPLGRALAGALLAPDTAEALLAPFAAETPSGRVVVQPNFQVLVVGDVPEETVFALSEVAELQRADQVVELKLTRESVYAAQQAGWTASEILALLERATGSRPAQNVTRSISDWAAAHERIVVRRNATLLAAAAPDLLDRLDAAPDVAPLLGERLLPNLALLRPGAAGPAAARRALDRRLLALGELAATSDLGRPGARPLFTFDPAGRVTWRTPVPDLRLLGLLAGLTRPDAAGTLMLDESTVRASAAAQEWRPETVAALLETLAAWHVGSLPDSVTRRVKAWGGYLGQARVRTVTIVEVERPELMDELLADPALAGLLTPLPAGGTVALLTLAPPARGAGPPDLAAVRAALRAHGFTLPDDAA